MMELYMIMSRISLLLTRYKDVDVGRVPLGSVLSSPHRIAAQL